MEKVDLIKYLEKQGYQRIKEIPKRGLCGLQEFVFTIGLIHDLDEDGYGGRWCYPKERAVDAVLALELWDGEGDPPGPWIKYKGSVEYSNPNTH